MYAAAEILDCFRDRFITDTDASAIMYELEYRNIISSGDVAMIERYPDVTQQNHFLHARLMKTCTMRALIEVSDIMSAVRGNPKMNALGEDLRCAEGTCLLCYA